MKVKLLKDSRVFVKAGETVNVSPAVAKVLFSMKAAEEVTEAKPEPKPEPKPKTTTTRKKKG